MGDGNITLEKAKKNKHECKSGLNEIKKGKNKLKEQKDTLHNIETLYKAHEILLLILSMIILQWYVKLSTK